MSDNWNKIRKIEDTVMKELGKHFILDDLLFTFWIFLIFTFSLTLIGLILWYVYEINASIIIM